MRFFLGITCKNHPSTELCSSRGQIFYFYLFTESSSSSTEKSSFSGKGQQAAAAPTQRPHHPTRLQRHRLSQGEGVQRRGALGEAEEPLGQGRVDGAVEREVLGMGRTLRAR